MRHERGMSIERAIAMLIYAMILVVRAVVQIAICVGVSLWACCRDFGRGCSNVFELVRTNTDWTS